MATGFLTENYDTLFPQFTAGELCKDIDSFLAGKGKLFKLLKHFFYPVMVKCKRHGSRYTPWEVLHDDALLEKVWERVRNHPDLFAQSNGVGCPEAFKICTRVGSNKLCDAVSNFPAREAAKIYLKYVGHPKVHPNHYSVHDPSAGFGVRMCVALLLGYNYYATDPNAELVQALRKCSEFLRGAGYVKAWQESVIVCTGSEVPEPSWGGEMHFSFTSPPYFSLESYSNDSYASTSNYGNYAKWGKEYVIPTIKNIRSYLRPGGKAAINIKSFGKYDLYGAWSGVFKGLGFEELPSHSIKVTRRAYGAGHGEIGMERAQAHYRCGTSEDVMVFRKGAVS